MSEICDNCKHAIKDAKLPVKSTLGIFCSDKCRKEYNSELAKMNHQRILDSFDRAILSPFPQHEDDALL